MKKEGKIVVFLALVAIIIVFINYSSEKAKKESELQKLELANQHRLKAIEYLKNGEYAFAIEKYNASLSLSPNNIGSINGMALAYQRMGMASKARETFEQSLAAQPTFPETYRYLGTLSYSLGDYENAKTEYEKAIEFAPENPIYYAMLGHTYRKMNDFDKALHYYNLSLSLDENNPLTRSALESLYYQRGEYSKAEKYIASLQNIDDPGLNSPVTHLRIELFLEEYAKADEIANNMANNQKDRFLGVFYQGVILIFKGNAINAHSLFTQAANIAENNATELQQADLGHAFASLLEKDYGKANKYLDSVFTYGNSKNAELLRGYMQSVQTGALITLGSSTDKRKADVLAYQLLGKISEANGDKKLAQEVYGLGLLEYPGNEMLKNSLR